MNHVTIIEPKESLSSAIAPYLDNIILQSQNDYQLAIEDLKQNEIIVVDIDTNEQPLDTIKNLANGNTPIVALSHMNDEQQLLASFDAGAKLVLAKSTPAKLAAKQINRLINFQNKVTELHIEEANLSELVDTTMTQASFYGACLDLVSDLQFANSEENIATYLFDFMSNYGIGCAISFSNPSGRFGFDQQTYYCSPIEQQVFEVLKGKGRIYEFANRAVFNSPSVSLLIKNMPAKDTVNYGLFIDVFAKLVPSVEMSYINLLNKQKLSNTQSELKQAVTTIQEAAVEMQNARQQLVDEIVMEIGLSFHQYEFTDEQEKFLTDLIETNVVKQSQSSERFLSVNEQLNDLVESISETQSEDLLKDIAPANSSEIELF